MMRANSPKKARNFVIPAYLESVSGKLSEYIVEIGPDKLLIKSKNTNKLKMEFDIQTIAPFAGSEKVMMTEMDNDASLEKSTLEESKILSA